MKESYEEICPNCHGDYRKSIAQTCSRCHGRGYFSCEVKCGEHHKEIKCDNCDGTGYVTCSHCRGSGSEKCPDCEAREREAKKQREREEREAKERLEREKERREKREREERNRRIEAQEKKEAAEKVAKERRDAIQGCGCVIAVTATIGFFIWWWLEGFTTAALPGMWEQARTFVGGTEGVAKIFCGLVVLFLGWKLITMFKRKKDGSDEPRSQKKRWKFVVLGLLFGFLGLHLAYAKRWFLFLLLWAAFITGGVMSGGKGEPDKPTADAGGTVQAPPPTDSSKKDETVKKEADNPISGIGFAVWGLLWIGGTLFIKKDGKGNRM
ncbi:MAG: hypothetical protein IKO72_14430 [Kiritimatiellae bacterium]|nr:hypothetical protein [Kiritimatiellia bacterium]